MTTEYIKHASEADWLADRNQDVTSTESSALFGMSPYDTLFTLWHRKASGQADPFHDNERMEAGRHIEPAIASLVAARYGLILEPFKRYARDPVARMGSSFDYMCVGVTDTPVEDESIRDLFRAHGPGQIECKNVDGLVFRKKWTDDETPAHIEIQLQHQMELSGMRWGSVVALVGGNRLVPYVRMRDEAVGLAIRAAIRSFWKSVTDNVPPPAVMPDDADAVIALNQFASDRVYDAREDNALTELLAEYDDLNAAKKKAEEDMKVIKANVLVKVGDAGSIVWSGGKVSLYQTKDNPGKPITADMIGQIIGQRSGFRAFKSTPTKAQEASTP